MSYTNNSNGFDFSKLFDFFIKYGVIIMVAIYVVPYAIQYIKTMIADGKADKVAQDVATNNSENAVFNPSSMTDKANTYLRDKKHFDLKTRQMLMTASQKLSVGFGRANLAWYNPKSWSEDDKSIYEVLNLHTLNYAHLQWLYYNVYTQSQNLTNDVINHLDNEYIVKLRVKYKKFNLNIF